MPELPEVETTVRGLRQTIVGKKITEVWTDWPKMIRGQSFSAFKKKILGKKIIEANRRGKNILITLSDGEVLLAHMKMTGHFLYGPFKKKGGKWTPNVKEGPLLDPYNRFIHLVFSLSDGNHLAFSDMRKFGKVLFLEKDEAPRKSSRDYNKRSSLIAFPRGGTPLQKTPSSISKLKVFWGGGNAHLHKDLAPLGPEPLEKTFTWQKFRERLKGRPNGKIKQVLLDQSVVAGIGNIYSDEMLWETAIHPETRVKKLNDKNFQALYKSMKKILTKSIKVQGDSKSDYRNVYGRRGSFQNFHKAYGRTNLPCPKKGCGGTIRRLVIGSRSAHFCDKHQKRA